MARTSRQLERLGARRELARVEIEETLAAIAKLAPNTRVTGSRPAMKAAPIRAVDQMRVAFV